MVRKKNQNTRLPGVGKVSQLKPAGEHFGLDSGDVRYHDPVRACEVCGKERPSSDMINLICVIGSPGHSKMAPFQHPEEEHWACCPDHWQKLGHLVIDEMKSHLEAKHAVEEESVHHGSACQK